MTGLSAEEFWTISDSKLQAILDSNEALSRQKRIHFYAPSFMYYKTSHYCSLPTAFPTISITGKDCALKCRHCGGIVLETMHPAVQPQQLYELCQKLKQEGAMGCLISGGCLPNGSVPIERFMEAISKIKQKLDLTVLVHTGTIDLKTAKALKTACVDAALIDIVGSDETIREIFGLNVTVQDYAHSLKALHDSGLAFVPHVIVGLHYGQLLGELNALKIVSDLKPSALVIIAFMPIRGTMMENIEPPKPLDIARTIATARAMFPETPLVLGCMRPKGKHRAATDVLALKAGVDAIAFPSEEVIRFAENAGSDISFSSFCCSQIYVDLLSEQGKTIRS